MLSRRPSSLCFSSLPFAIAHNPNRLEQGPTFHRLNLSAPFLWWSRLHVDKCPQAVLRAVSEGDLTPLEGAAVMNLVEGFRRVLELSEYEGRIKALERALEGDFA